MACCCSYCISPRGAWLLWGLITIISVKSTPESSESSREWPRRKKRFLRLGWCFEVPCIWFFFLSCCFSLHCPSIFFSLSALSTSRSRLLPLRWMKVVAPAEPQAVVASRWLLYLLLITRTALIKDGVGLSMESHTWTGIRHFSVNVKIFSRLMLTRPVRRSAMCCFCIQPPQI